MQIQKKGDHIDSEPVFETSSLSLPRLENEHLAGVPVWLRDRATPATPLPLRAAVEVTVGWGAWPGLSLRVPRVQSPPPNPWLAGAYRTQRRLAKRDAACRQSTVLSHSRTEQKQKLFCDLHVRRY